MTDSELSRKRPEATFAFGMFGIEGGFAVSHQYDRTPAIIRPGDPVLLRTATVPGYVAVNAYVVDGDGPYTPGHIAAHGEEVPFYRSGNDWIATLFGKPDRTTSHYIVEATLSDGTHHYADGRLPLEKAKVFAHRTTSRKPPAWTRDTVVYQIFVDRFANKDGILTMPEPDYGWAGGDLDGVTAHLGWLSELGVDCVWLTPIFTCNSYHGYDTADMKSVDERFGGDEALRRLVTAAHDRDIRIILDFVPNHISHEHPWFRDAIDGGPKRDWFFIEDDGSYQKFFTAHTMPKVNLDNPDARAAMLDVARYWIEEFGIDGYRIDHALGPSESFFANLTSHVENIDPEVWMFGEVTATAHLSRRYGGILDGVTDFPFAYGLRELLAGRLAPEAFAEIERESAAVLSPDEFSWVRFFDNHDMARAIHGWEGSEETLEHALEILLSLPGVPSIFYGTEQALSHRRSEAEGGLSVGRVPMRFDPSAEILAAAKRLIAQRRASSAHQGTPVYWTDHGSAWRWGNNEGHL
ncbi:MAG: alpha-amylase family glycosyl hydrolase [Actinomycetota bacterium]